ncbi:MAG TPA: flagellar biosynthesis anti-sigma factor FlgM [Acidobacteriaceae bacterium]|jgi:flagellar biosynthesis anti-sigma factor FlgM
MEIRSQSQNFQPLDSIATVSAQAASGGAAGSPQRPLQQDVASLNFGQALSGDDVRTERVQALQLQITSGTYQVSAQGVAGKLMNSMVEQA